MGCRLWCRPFLWKVNGGQCSLEEFGFMHDNKLTEDFAISVRPGEYHRFGYETDGKQIRLYVDGELQKEISIPYGPAFVSVVTDTEDEIIIKAVNFCRRCGSGFHYTGLSGTGRLYRNTS